MGKHLTLSSLQTILPPIKHLIDKKAENVDWNENDLNAKGYVRNRPFYEERKIGSIVPNTTVTFSECWNITDLPFFDLIRGETYTVIFDGVSYSCVAVDDGYGGEALGNFYIVGEGADTGEPFFICEEENGQWNGVAISIEETVDCSLEILGPSVTIHKIDEKFLYRGALIGKSAPFNGAEIFNDYENNGAVGDYSHAEGRFTDAIGSSSHAEGYSTNAKGPYSHSEGWFSFSQGYASHAEGYETTTFQNYGHSEGLRTHTFGLGGHSEGFGTESSCKISGTAGMNTCKAYANYAIRPGGILYIKGRDYYSLIINSTYVTASNGVNEYDITLDKPLPLTYTNEVFPIHHASAYGDYSHSEGWSTVAASEAQHAQGRFNKADCSDKYAHIVGNGTSSTNRSNAHTLDWSGNAWYQGDVYVGGSGQDDAAAEKLVKQSELSEATSDLASQAHVEAVTAALGNSKANKAAGVFYIEGTGTTGTWYGYHPDITEYYNGLMIAYKIGIDSLGSKTTLNINELGAVAVVRNATTDVDASYRPDSVVFLVYTTDSDGTSYWKIADYDSNTITTTRTTNLINTKMYLIGGVAQQDSIITNSNINCYIGTDNCLYSGGEKVAVVSDLSTGAGVSAITSDRINAICNSTTT